MGNYTILGGLENPRRGRQARNLTTNVPKILDLKSSSEQIFSKNCRWVPLGESRRHKFFRFPPLEHQLTIASEPAGDKRGRICLHTKEFAPCAKPTAGDRD